jgi:hypothetical protein
MNGIASSSAAPRIKRLSNGGTLLSMVDALAQHAPG